MYYNKISGPPTVGDFFLPKRSRRIAIIKARVFNHSNLTGGCIFFKKENKLHNKRMIYVTNRNQKLWWWGWSGYLLVSLKMMTSTFGSTLNAQGAAAADDCVNMESTSPECRVCCISTWHATFFSPSFGRPSISERCRLQHPCLYFRDQCHAIKSQPVHNPKSPNGSLWLQWTYGRTESYYTYGTTFNSQRAILALSSFLNWNSIVVF